MKKSKTRQDSFEKRSTRWQDLLNGILTLFKAIAVDKDWHIDEQDRVGGPEQTCPQMDKGLWEAVLGQWGMPLFQ